MYMVMAVASFANLAIGALPLAAAPFKEFPSMKHFAPVFDDPEEAQRWADEFIGPGTDIRQVGRKQLVIITEEGERALDD